MASAVEELFERFISECPKDHLEPADRLRFSEFLIALHTSGKWFFMPEKMYELQDRGLEPAVLQQMSEAFDTGLVLLRAYDRSKMYATAAA